MTFLYARMWRHSNLDARTHAKFPTLVGRAPGDVYRQLYFFALRERLTTQDGLNDYLTKDNLCTRWRMPTVFFHGEESRVFSPKSATRSARNLHDIVNRQGGANIPVRVCLIPGYGHMDVIFGKNAHVDVFGDLTAFFADPRKLPGAPPTGAGDGRRRLPAGPILRAAWAEDGLIYARLWAEADEDDAALVDDMTLVSEDAEPCASWLTGVGQTEEEAYAADRRYHLMDVELAPSGSIRFALQAAAATSKPVAWDADLPWLERLRQAAQGQRCRDMRFIVGSCRYPGTPFESEASDLVYRGILGHVDGAQRPAAHLLFLVGDQIYADATANILDAEAWRERYCKQYRDAFTTPYARRVLAQVPTHFAIDDHELMDNWSGQDPLAPGGREPRDAQRARETIEHAVRAATFFQGSGRDRKSIGPATPPPGLWYALDDVREHCCPTFVMNTRSERHLRRAGAGRNVQFVSRAQLDAVERWLADANRPGDPRRDMPKFIFCGVGIAPISRDYAAFPETWRSSDWWLGYPRALTHVLGTIVRDQIPHVVFVSGDLHLSSLSRLELRADGAEMIAWQVVSSGLYAPMPFANADLADYDWNQPVRVVADDDVGGKVEICAESGVLCSGPPHFVRVDAEQATTRWSLGVRVGGSDGELLDPLGPPPKNVHPGHRSWHVPL
jgi:cholesterol oxidase